FRFVRNEGRIQFNGATVELRADGKPTTPESAENAYDIAGTGVKLFFPPVRQRPKAAPNAPLSTPSPTPSREPLLDSAERLISLLHNSADYVETYYTLTALVDKNGPMGPYLLRLGGKDLLVSGGAVDQVLR